MSERDNPSPPDPSGMLGGAPPKVIAADNPFGELASTLEVDDRDAAARRAAEVEDAIPGLPVTRKIYLMALCLAALLGAPYLHPRLEWLRLFTERAPAEEADPVVAAPIEERFGEASLPGPTMDQQARADELEGAKDARSPLAQKASVPEKVLEEGEVKQPVEDPAGKLAPFFDKLMRAESKEKDAIVRVLYYGDSIVASDFVTGKLRRLYQSRFGDAGHGYAIIANAWPGWFHIDVSRESSAHWKTSRCVTPYNDDGFYGLGCVSFVVRQKDAWFSMGTATRDEWGRSVSRFELEYYQQPGGGDVRLSLDGNEHEVLSTDGEAGLKYHTVQTSDGPHTLEVRTLDDREVRLFGMRMERDVPGVTLSAMGITGARARFLDKQDDAHWAAVLKAAKPDLVILAFGSNEVTDGGLYLTPDGHKSKTPTKDYEESLRAVMKQVTAAVPESSVMLVGPPDMASNKPEWGHSRPQVNVIVESQRKLAKEEGWAFFDQFKAMGGAGSMWAWMKSGLGNSDMFHPTGSGGNVLGRMQYLAMMQAYEQHKDAKR